MTTPEQHDRYEVAPGAVGGPEPQAHAMPVTGALAWWIGFVSLVPVPIVSQIVSWVAPVVTHVRLRPAGGFAAEVSRQAANWQLTFATITIGGFALTGIVVLVLETAGVTTDPRAFIPWFVLITIAGIATIVHMVLGGTKAGRGEVHRPRGSIPFFKPVA
ncbi:DUF4870 domain-containing protein [Agrococcus jejuensis]|uniref:Uncharacterized conserved protein, Tic20 family n=1 Tax=Agrococcus jejuensis TaxID=399736 RepID=A0A1G8EUS1_9MICO|nr:DUF4870 domain-containing protein [Agrococcus jejuensis]SDH73656.1 Uncharacterized conserved protein, Tic20 family [Agrococcus jejuensis]